MICRVDFFFAWSLSARRAWIEITVVGVLATLVTSLSARRAWIEIGLMKCQVKKFSVALRKESVDRNDAVQIIIIVVHASLSARRAWIEISIMQIKTATGCGRSPQGERG